LKFLVVGFVSGDQADWGSRRRLTRKGCAVVTFGAG
jgi:hypothetical protein